MFYSDKNQEAGIIERIYMEMCDRKDEKEQLTETSTEEFEKWKSDVSQAHPDKKLKFTGRVEGNKMTTSAEVPGEDRSYGVWDHDDNTGHVFKD